LTGDFLKYYEQFTQQIVGPAAKQKGVKTTAVVLRAALSGELHPDSASVLLFVNQTTQSKDRPEPTMTSSSVVAMMTKADGKWFISSFNPT
jgi:Mce-associated membrane protein